jgi:hypothetical protein
MTRLIQQHPTLAARLLPRLVMATLVALLLTASVADAALTTGACLVQKRKAWGNFRKCQVTEQVKLVKGKPTDLAACDTALHTALTKISAKATKAGIACRYRDNADSTITDYDTGLMWENKNAGNVGDRFTWIGALKDFPEGYNQCASSDGAILGPCSSLYHDWRLPNIVELQSIVDLGAAGCGSGSACIDPIFNPTVAGDYWSATTVAPDPNRAWFVAFFNGNVSLVGKDFVNGAVRAVRTGL